MSLWATRVKCSLQIRSEADKGYFRCIFTAILKILENQNLISKHMYNHSWSYSCKGSIHIDCKICLYFYVKLIYVSCLVVIFIRYQYCQT